MVVPFYLMLAEGARVTPRAQNLSSLSGIADYQGIKYLSSLRKKRRATNGSPFTPEIAG
jgi:hypothetical protein